MIRAAARCQRLRSTIARGLLAVALCVPVAAQTTERLSLSSSGTQGNGDSGFYSPSVSSDGRTVAFDSAASNLVAGDMNGSFDVFVRNRERHTTERVSVPSNGTEAHGDSFWPSISADGRFVAFVSTAADLVAGDTNGKYDIFVHDRESGATERVSVDSGGGQANDDSYEAAISADGRFVVFSSLATNLVPGDTNGLVDVFVHDRLTGSTERVSVGSAGGQGNGYSARPSISGDGRYVAFQSSATNLVPGDTNSSVDVFVRDRRAGTTERVSVQSGGGEADSDSDLPSISIDGEHVAFASWAVNLVVGDTNGVEDVFVHDRTTGTTERVSVGTDGSQGNGNSGAPSISADGHFVVFDSNASNLMSGDTNGSFDVFLRDRRTNTTARISVTASGGQGNGHSRRPVLSASGRYVTFSSSSTNLTPPDTNGVLDVFLRDRAEPAFESLCNPGVGGVVQCPCSNPPGEVGRGCENSAGTGGAVLWGSGQSDLSVDSLVLSAGGLPPGALSIVLQGDALLSTGRTYGQGVRCLRGRMERLYVKTAHAGSITAPDFLVGDSYISERSAALGHPIQPGENRWYLVYYRDPVILGGCPASSTFNATQTGRATWWP